MPTPTPECWLIWHMLHSCYGEPASEADTQGTQISLCTVSATSIIWANPKSLYIEKVGNKTSGVTATVLGFSDASLVRHKQKTNLTIHSQTPVFIL